MGDLYVKPEHIVDRTWVQKQSGFLPIEHRRIDIIHAMAELNENCAIHKDNVYLRSDSHSGAHWAMSHIRCWAPGVYSFPYLNPSYIKHGLLNRLRDVTYEVNTDEPVEAQIPEAVLCQKLPSDFACLSEVWEYLGRPLAHLLLSQDPTELRTIQAARYTESNTPGGAWHTDGDSDITLTVSLGCDFGGGGTAIYQGPFHPICNVPGLPMGHALMFNGKAHKHMGLPVTHGTRELLVHWSETK